MKSHRFARCNTPAALARRKARNEARSIAGPSPEYPPHAMPGSETGEYVEIQWRGQFVRLDLCRPFPPGPCVRARSDQASVRLGGEVLIDAAGLVVILDTLRAMVQDVRAPSLRQYASMQNGYTARDEADAAGSGVSQLARRSLKL